MGASRAAIINAFGQIFVHTASIDALHDGKSEKRSVCDCIDSGAFGAR